MEFLLKPDPFREYMVKTYTISELGVEIEDFSPDALAKFADKDGFLTKSFIVNVKNRRFRETTVISTFAKYEGCEDKYPAIQLRIVDSSKKTLYYSPVYEIGSRVEYYRREWRLPPVFEGFDTVRLEFFIPDGIKLHVRDIMVKHNYSSYRENDIGIRYHGHGGCTSALGMQLTAELGFTSCITIPKFTKDKIGVCFHDDSTVIKEARLDDGSKIPEGSEFDKPVCEFTYEELLNLNIWRAKGDAFRGMRVPTMDEYFKICSNTGMKPIFSVHPALTREEWLEVRRLLIKYRLLEHFWVKSNQKVTHERCLDVFGDEIGYIIIQGKINGILDEWTIDEFAKSVGLDKSRHRITAEFFNGLVTEEKIKKTLEDGYPVSIAAMGGGISGPRMQNLIDLGVTEFTLDRHCSMGLSW